jgi:hypothetical protein
MWIQTKANHCLCHNDNFYDVNANAMANLYFTCQFFFNGNLIWHYWLEYAYDVDVVMHNLQN